MRITFVPGIPPGANVNICIGGRYKCYFIEGQGGSVPTLIMIKGSWRGQKPVQLSVEQGGLHRVCVYRCVLHGRQSKTPGISHYSILPRQSVAPEATFDLTRGSGPIMGWRGCREHHIIPMLPQHPSYQEQEAVIVLLRHGGGARSCPRRPDRDSGRLHAQLCPDV
jgi:hypothetical protein